MAEADRPDPTDRRAGPIPRAGTGRRRRLRRAGWTLAGLYLAYLIAGHLFLNTAIGPWAINRKPDRFAMDWSHGLTWWPGSAMLWNVEVRGQVRRVAWTARTGRGSGHIALWPLLRRELRLTAIDAVGVTAEIGRAGHDLLPPPPRPGGWAVRLDAITAHGLPRVRLGPLDLSADGTARFGLFKQLRGGPLEIFPSEARLTAVKVVWGEQTLLRDGRAEAHFALPRHRREDAAGIAKLALADASLELQAAVPALAVDLDASGRIVGSFDADADAGSLTTRLAWQRGALTAGGTLAARLPLRATRPGARFANTLDIGLAVDDTAIRLDADLPRHPQDPRSLQAQLTLDGNTIALPLDGAALLRRVHGEIATDWSFESLAWLGPLLIRVPWLQLEGAGSVQARLSLREGRVQPGSTLTIPEVAVAATVAGHRFDGRAHADARIAEGESQPVAEVALAVERFDVVATDALDRPLVHGRDLRIELQAPEGLDGLRAARARLRFEQAEVPDLRVFNTYLPGADLRLLGGSSRLSGDLSLDAAGEIATGRVRVEGRDGRVQLGRLGFAGNFDLDGRLARADLASGRFDLDGSTLRLDRVQVLDAGRSAGERWWARIGVTRGHVVAGRPLALSGQAAIEMENIGLLLTLFAQRKDYPRWVLGLADKGRLRATGQMQVRGDSIVFDRVEAANDRFEVKARMRIADAQPHGDLLLRWGVLALGVELRDEARELHLLGAKDWYARRPPLLPAR